MSDCYGRAGDRRIDGDANDCYGDFEFSYQRATLYRLLQDPLFLNALPRPLLCVLRSLPCVAPPRPTSAASR
jgi:hypothetical protein